MDAPASPMEALGKSTLWLRGELASPAPRLHILDCRSRERYDSCHVAEALSVALPGLLLHRLRKGNLSACSLLPGRAPGPGGGAVLLYDEGAGGPPCPSQDQVSVLGLLLRRLREEGCAAYYLQGGFAKFQAEWPDQCVPSADRPGPSSPPAPPVVGLGGLSLGTGEDLGPLSSGAVEAEGASPPSYPVQILPHLYLGSARDSADQETLARLGIRYVLNVTPNLPNLFAEQGGFHYKQIPISDHWSQNLAHFFPEAIAFIDEALAQNCGVLVHCLAGVSRSVTVTVAYLMQRLSLPLNEAYELVKRKKADISPNFSFLGQLLDFERELGLAEGLPQTPASASASCFPVLPPQREEEDGQLQHYPT